MKTITFFKKLSFVAVAGLFALTSCEKSNTEPEVELNEEAKAIVVAEASTSADAVLIVNAIPEGGSKDSIAAAELPASVATYLATNYNSYTFFKTFKAKKNGNVDSYIVVIKFNGKPVGLKFDANGNFVRVFEQRERGQLNGKGWKQGGRFDGRDGQHRDTIALTALSTTIKAYFLLNHPQDTLLAAHAGRGGDIVVISANNGLHATVFNLNNVFLKRALLILHQGKKIAVKQIELSAKIATHLASTYPGYVFHRAYVVKINSTVQAYVVLIDSGDTKYALHFDANGNLVKHVVVR